jgi:hypothetical protein
MRGKGDASSRLPGRTRHVLIALAAAAALATACAPLAAQTPQQVQSAAEQAIRRLDLQTGFPTGPEPERFSLNLPPEVLWIVIAIALGIILYAFKDMLPAGLRWGQGSAWSDDQDASAAAAGRAPGALQDAADELAAQGRFVEAMHALLLRGLAEIRQRLDEQFADSLTSREILHRARLPQEGRTSLQDIVRRVEWTYFGEHPAGQADYLACRKSFDVLARALHGGGTA